MCVRAREVEDAKRYFACSPARRAELAGGERAEFDGKGFCFLELPGRKVAYVEGNWYARPKPEVRLSEADAEQFRRKQHYERDRLAEWLGDPRS